MPLAVWSWVFEIFLPHTEMFRRYCFADHRDVLAYAAGALGAAVVWQWWYRDGEGVNGSDPKQLNRGSHHHRLAANLTVLGQRSRQPQADADK